MRSRRTLLFVFSAIALALLATTLALAAPGLPGVQAAPTVTLRPAAYLPIVRRATLPGATTLSAINNPSSLDHYTVSWATAPNATAYRLEQDDNAGFTHPSAVYVGAGKSWVATSRPADKTLYYRVRGTNGAGSGPWSNIQATRVLATPNDPGFGQQWWLSKINAPQAWLMSKGRGIVVAVVDTGADLTHPDLQAKIVAGRNFVAGNDIPQDDNGHGSHVSGIAGAVTNNGGGVAGLGWDASIMPVKVLDYNGSGSLSNVVSGIEWAADHGARVINLSLGASSLSPAAIQALQTATDYAWGKGSLVIAASGNCGDPDTYMYNGCSTLSPISYPAALPNVLGVGATTIADTRAGFSSYGSWVDVAAPGDGIYSTYYYGSYETESGTSMATPVVSGLAALIWSHNPGLTNAQVAQIIMQSAIDLQPAGRDDQFGWGRINAPAAVQAAASGVAPAAWHKAGVTSQGAAVADDKTAVEPGVVLVRMKPGAQALQALSVRSVTSSGIMKVEAPAGQERARAAELAANPDVEFAVPDYIIQWIK